jgi:hypothetical protein
MMNNKKVLKALAFILSERGLGKTELLKRGISNYDRPFIYVCMTKEAGVEAFRGKPNPNAKLVSIDRIEELIGEHKPVIVDQEVIKKICTDSWLCITELENLLKTSEN